MHSDSRVLLMLLCGVAYLLHATSADNGSSGPYYISSDEHELTTGLTDSILCSNLRPQHTLDILQIMGLWYGSEIIMHTQDVPGVYQYDSCVIIHLADITEQMQMREPGSFGGTDRRRSGIAPAGGSYVGTSRHQHDYGKHEYAPMPTHYLRLLWSEKDHNLEYHLNYTLSAPGIWVTAADQRGSFAHLDTYQQFKGSVQVVKAVNDHLVLTFCGTDLHSSIYSIVLTRHSQGLSLEELRSVKNLLSRRGLYTDSIRKVCSSGAAKATAALQTLISAFLLLLLACQPLLSC